ncbi:unnamed protein product [Laminaria digitata]
MRVSCRFLCMLSACAVPEGWHPFQSNHVASVGSNQVPRCVAGNMMVMLGSASFVYAWVSAGPPVVVVVIAVFVAWVMMVVVVVLMVVRVVAAVAAAAAVAVVAVAANKMILVVVHPRK